ncbi:MAG: DUF222 domain-containing protein, partial [Marmoricola sp.]
MTSLLDQQTMHPLVRLVGELEAVTDDAGNGPAWTLTPTELVDLLPRLAVVLNRLEATQLAVLREADRQQVGDPVGAASTAGWWSTAVRTTRAAAHRAVALATSLDDDHHWVRAGFAAGAVPQEQAAVIVGAIDALPSDLVDPPLRADAEQHLVALAAHHDPTELRVLGRRILDVVAPEVAEEHERQVLEREEEHALATASFSMTPDGAGSVVGRFKIPALAGAMLDQHLAALASPKHRAASATGTSTRVSRPLRLGTAFVEYVETRSPDDTPSAGGLPATVVVTMTLEALLGAEQVATLDTGARISASQARRLACEAGIIPAVLGSRSTVLDLGRRTRFHTAPQRTALGLRDHGCAEQHCDWPPARCHAHHPLPWSRGGSTSVENGMLLCPRHHTLAHDARYQLKTGPHG